jgi:hypothetical protein
MTPSALTGIAESVKIATGFDAGEAFIIGRLTKDGLVGRIEVQG